MRICIDALKAMQSQGAQAAVVTDFDKIIACFPSP